MERNVLVIGETWILRVPIHREGKDYYAHATILNIDDRPQVPTRITYSRGDPYNDKDTDELYWFLFYYEPYHPKDEV